MTSSKIYKFPTPESETKKETEEDLCPKCQSPMAWRQEFPYPVISQVFFGLSFIVFLFTYEKIQDERQILWAWSTLQIGLGFWLVRGRIRARRRVLRCVRCSTDLP